MNQEFFFSVAATGFVIAFAHAAIPTHWLPFVLAGRGQRWCKAKTLLVVALCGTGHVLFTTLLGILVVWLGIETSKWTGQIFPWIAGGAVIAFGLYYLVRQARGGGHGHRHFGGGHSHDHGDHNHASETKRIDTGHGVLVLEIFEDGVPPRFRVRTEGAPAPLPHAAAVLLETVRPDGARQSFAFAARNGYLESVEEIPEPHAFTATLGLSHGDHAHLNEVHFEEHSHAVAGATEAPPPNDRRPAATLKSDRAVIIGLFTLLTFSPCEGFLPVYLSGISYGWIGFAVLSAVLAGATLAGMILFTALTMLGLERFKLQALEKYESAILGVLLCGLGVAVILLET